ncbi:MAG: HNH endonuclease signature motif containing protein [Clostridia bacterium]|nr:HNH endonuclease signature motif containing protein [Clostridia bacterium]
MPRSPKRPCRYPGCPNLCESGVYCKTHAPECSHDRFRGGGAARGYDSRWRKARARFLKAHPLCAECQRQGKLAPATVVDHILPHRGDERLFWDKSNWQPLCKRCHDRKTGGGL